MSPFARKSRLAAAIFGSTLCFGCQDNAFCFDCATSASGGNAPQETATGGDVGIVIGDFDAGLSGCGATNTPTNCGQCGNRCERAGAFPSCVEQSDRTYACQYACAPGRSDMNQDLASANSDGCEYACVPTNGGVEICDGIDNDCNGVADEGTDTQSDPNNCGACGVVCRLSQATAGCALVPDAQGVPAPTCVVLACASGYQNRDGQNDNGCEYLCEQTNRGVEICDGVDNDCNGLVDDADPALDLSSDPDNCGSCGLSCAGRLPNSHGACTRGECSLGTCLDGYFDKDQDPTNGCEATCNVLCSFPFATATCDNAGSCTMVACLPGYYDLDHNPSNGCEYGCQPSGPEVCDGIDNDCNGLIDAADPAVQVTSDLHNCGACGQSCAGQFPNAQATCQNGACALASCNRGFFDRDSDPKNGCEYSCFECAFAAASSDLDACIAAGGQGQPRCALGQCETGFLNLDGDPSNGCEYQCTQTNLAGGTSQGVEVCDGLDNDCNGLVDDVSVEGQLATDVRNCGACGHSCEGLYPNATSACVGGQCAFGGCLGGYFDRDLDPANGCETQCSGVCSFPFATSVCDDRGSCAMGTCISSSYHDLDGSAANGCEYFCEETNIASGTGHGVEICDGLDNDCNGVVDDVPSAGQVATDPSNCGACGRSCTGLYPNASAGCSAGGCVLGACDSGYFNNDGDPANGCEFACLDCSYPGGVADYAACLGSGTPGPAHCVLGSCLDGYQNRDLDPANGCEIQCAPTHGGVEICDGIDNDCNGVVDDVLPTGQIATDPRNCGACGNSCVGGFANAEAGCTGGTCLLAACEAGYFDSDASPTNGCEFSCFNCSFTAATSDFSACVASAAAGPAHCVMGPCSPGFVDLDHDPATGCEYQCSVTNSGVEICDGIDNDCNHVVDDVPSNGQIASDVRNCGACGHNCGGEVPNAVAACLAGACVVGSCLDGYFDRNGLAGDGCEYQCAVACRFPFANALCDALGGCSMGTCYSNYFNLDGQTTNGCEYFCQQTNPATESCDAKDNDCNGAVDDVAAATVASDPMNCGACGQSCAGRFANAQPACSSGACVLGTCLSGYFDRDGNPTNGCEFSCGSCSFPGATSNAGACAITGTCTMGTCLGGYYDVNGNAADGCEYTCQPTNPPTEVCDGKDNNCNGTVDEGFDFNTDAHNCGGCGIDCSLYFPYSTVACQLSSGLPTCVWTGCVAGHYNRDGVSQNGCEYGCTPTSPSTELCDNIDNDCDGTVDNPPGGVFNPALPDACGSSNPLERGECQAGTVCRNGTPTCTQIKGPGIEECNGLDDDCDGVIDNPPVSGNLPQVGTPCGQTDVGECEFGATQCQPATAGNPATDRLVCVGEIPPATETCNLKDDNCNGVVDDDVPSTSCGESATGACRRGTTRCSNGTTECVGNIDPGLELCDANGATSVAYDNDCDGTVDEGCLRPAAGSVRLDAGGINGAPTSTPAQHSTYQLAAASVGDLFFVAYADQRDGTSHLYGSYSLDGGLNWASTTASPPVVGDLRVTPNAAAEVEPNVFVRASRAYIVYSRFSGAIRQIYVSAAAQGTTPYYRTWNTERRLDGNGSSTAIDCFSPQGVVAKQDPSTGGTNDLLAVVWNEIGGTALTPTRNVYLRYTKNGSGNTWAGSPLVVNTTGGAANNTANNMGELPVIATDGAGMVYVAWRDKSMGGARVFFRRINLNATTPGFEVAFPLQPDTAAHDVVADDLRIAADSAGNVHVAWSNLSDNTIRVASATACGTSSTQAQCQNSFTTLSGSTNGLVVNPDSLSAMVAKPSLAARAGKVVVAWEDTRSGAADIRVNRASYVNDAWNWLASTARADVGDPLGNTMSADPSVAFGQNNQVVVSWVDLRDPAVAVYANVSLDDGATFYSGAGAYSLRMDATVADSLTPLVLATPNASRASVVWLDFSTSSGANSTNGDVYARLLQ